VANELYLLLLNKAEELKVVKSGTIGNVRILDAAFVPVEPAGPRAGGVLPLALVLGLLLGVGAAMGRAALREGIDDPETLEREAGLPVYASIPHSDPQEALVRVAGEGTVPLLAEVRPDDLAIEALRSLRTSLLFALAEARNNVVAVGGPGPSLGKSFVCANLARLLAEGGTRVVVVDADLRRGHLHSYLGGGKAPGLSDVVAGTADLKRVVRSTTTPNLSFLSCGQQATNPADMLGSRRYVEIVEALSRDHDLVLVDTAPVLAVTDGALAARPAGLALLVLRAGKHPLREVVLAVKRLAQGGVATKALVLNDVRPKMPGRTAGHYQYEYARTTKGQGR
jgi:tyrosine-protein kinase Etk/Wzc